ncbi:Tether containing UBX domain for GLUT4 [Rhizophlyctis rosea]|uniref:Tether containing UBX domain for GLUT4 n=1 Tax=Rhizophlyctis rosea TaxID=64517 RepID=A0AAD5X179_9FUNG|nr:Tether containing UBX domain for GLUT4 [Rhizophlyctis rosea]
MASSVNVELDGEPFRKTLVKTTPAMSLRSVVDTACEKLKVGSSEGWGLKHGRNNLDLSLSIRFANLAAGAKLTLVRTRGASAGGGLVSIALQTDDGTRLMDKFPTTTTLWGILQHFEKKSNGSLNLTTRSGVPPPTEKQKFLKAFLKPNEEVYMMPVCIFMNQEYGSIEVLVTTTLQKAGLTSGNAVIRLLFRFSELSLDTARKEVGQWSTPAPTEQQGAGSSKLAPARIPTVPTNAPAPVAAPQTNTTLPNKHLPESIPTPPSSAPGQSQPIPHTTSNVEPALTNGSTISKPAEVVQTSPDIDMAQHQREESSQPSISPARSVTPMEIDQPAALQAAENRKAPGPAAPTLEPQQFDRDLKVFKPPKDDSGPSKIELPDDFFELTTAELKMLVAGSTARRAAIEGAPLMTKAMREREDELRRAKYPKTLIRVRFPNRITLQVTYWSGENVSTLYDVVRESLITPERPFTLYVTPPFRTLDPAQTFWKSGLAPATLVYFKWSDGDASNTASYLSNERMAALEDFPVPNTTPTPNLLGTPPADADKPADQEKKKPAWLEKLAPGNNGKKDTWGSGQRLGGSSSQDDVSGRGLFGDERDGPSGGSAGGSADDRGSKKPKWFKLGEQ